MKVILNVSENWYRSYQVEIPEGTNPSEYDSEAISVYLSWLKEGSPYNESVTNPSDPEYIDDAPSDTFFVEGVWDEI